MTRYVIDEGDMLLPDGWMDASLSTLQLDHPETGGMTLLVLRLPSHDQTLAEAVDTLVADQRRKLPRFELLERRACQLEGRATEQIAIRFATATAALYQRSVVTASGAGLLMLTTQGPADGAHSVDRIADAIQATVRWREPGGHDGESQP
jgi:hypothetical protein